MKYAVCIAVLCCLGCAGIKDGLLTTGKEMVASELEKIGKVQKATLDAEALKLGIALVDPADPDTLGRNIAAIVAAAGAGGEWYKLAVSFAAYFALSTLRTWLVSKATVAGAKRA